MSTLKRWTSSVTSSFDWVISQVENHEALVSNAIREMQNASQKASVQLARVRQDGTAMRERLLGLKQSVQQWEDRAIATQTEPERALECLRRKKRVEREIQQLELHLAEHGKLQTQLTQDLQSITAKVADLKRKKHALAARQYRAQAAQASRCDDLGLIGEIDEIFERWENKINECEPFELNVDSLEQEFLKAEEEAELQAELAAIAAKRAQ